MRTYKESFEKSFFFQALICLVALGMLLVFHVAAKQIDQYNSAKNDKGEYIVFVKNLNKPENGILEAQIWDSNREPRDYNIEEAFCEGKVWEAEMKYAETYQFVCPYPTYETVNDDTTSEIWTIIWILSFVGCIFASVFLVIFTLSKAYEVASLKQACKERLGID